VSGARCKARTAAAKLRCKAAQLDRNWGLSSAKYKIWPCYHCPQLQYALQPLNQYFPTWHCCTGQPQTQKHSTPAIAIIWPQHSSSSSSSSSRAALMQASAWARQARLIGQAGALKAWQNCSERACAAAAGTLRQRSATCCTTHPLAHHQQAPPSNPPQGAWDCDNNCEIPPEKEVGCG